MSELNLLLTSYPLSELIILIVLLCTAAKFIWSLWDFFTDKVNIRFGEKYKRQTRWDNLDKKLEDITQNLNSHIENISEHINELKQQNDRTYKHQQRTDNSLTLIQERLQETARSYLIDAHHKFCYEYGQIDDLSLQSIERRYLYYKTAGGDSFVDNLMEEIRRLPRTGYYNTKETKQTEGKESTNG